MDERRILHIDIKAFAVEVERVRDPALRERPVAVAPVSGGRALVNVASAEAQSEGVWPGMMIREALRRCPRLIVRPPDDQLYLRAQKAMIALLGRFSPLVEPEGLGHIYADLTGTGRLLGHSVDVAAKARTEILRDLRLSACAGLAVNKLVSRVAANEAPDKGVWDVFPGGEADFLAPLPVWRLPGTEESQIRQMLEEINLLRIKDMAALAPAHLRTIFGAFGIVLHQRACGIDPRPVVPLARSDEIHAENVLIEDTNDRDLLRAALWETTEMLGGHLRNLSLAAGKLTLAVRFSDAAIAYRCGLLSAVSDLDPELFKHASPMLDDICRRRVRVRFLRLSAGRAVRVDGQTAMWPEAEERRKRRSLQSALDSIRRKYGLNAVKYGFENWGEADASRTIQSKAGVCCLRN